ncbi:hypothetical protein M3147_18290 [Agromyces mediolanus]|uniref:5'-nucleotidase, lipoprotein e(P4) family n=1 Tax=Agromyces mediolanus TaxID=41986 RepID=UPI00203E1728|nr:HAD family acid phosphatase [Agromyces mediolanus]MCM3659208.1 hypothetical protein [Agromyces mediolanus]
MHSPTRRRSRVLPAVTAVVAAGLLTACTPGGGDTTPAAPSDENLYTAAVAWRVTAAERDALYRQGFNVARDLLDDALAAGHERPLAIVSDIDDTVLSSDSYWRLLLEEGGHAFDDALWDRWVAENGPTATPGAVEFLEYAESRGVEVFYVSQRDQGERTDEFGLANLRQAGLPFADAEHVTIQRDSSDKEEAQSAVAEQYEVVAYLGDNLNDFSRAYYVDGVEERRSLVGEDAEAFGRRFVLFPNPTDGHWVRAIFGESEPADSPEYRERFLRSATGEE